MKIEVFDVVELRDNKKAIILDIRQDNQYLVEIVNIDGEKLGNKIIIDKDISKIIYSK